MRRQTLNLPAEELQHFELLNRKYKLAGSTDSVAYTRERGLIFDLVSHLIIGAQTDTDCLVCL